MKAANNMQLSVVDLNSARDKSQTSQIIQTIIAYNKSESELVMA
jgi:hypothetical protein